MRHIPVVNVLHGIAFFVNDGEHVLLATLHLQSYGAESEAVGRSRVSPSLAVELLVVDVSVGYFGKGLAERIEFLLRTIIKGVGTRHFVSGREIPCVFHRIGEIVITYKRDNTTPNAFGTIGICVYLCAMYVYVCRPDA